MVIAKVTLAHGGLETDVDLVVTSSMKNDLLVDWRTLQELLIIPKNFPTPMTESVQVKSVKTQDLESLIHGWIKNHEIMFDDDGKLMILVKLHLHRLHIMLNISILYG